MKFKILSANSAHELEQLKKAKSHLAFGVFYAREGMIAEAEREFLVCCCCAHMRARHYPHRESRIARADRHGA